MLLYSLHFCIYLIISVVLTMPLGSEIHDNNNVILLYNITLKQQFTQRMSGVFSGEQLAFITSLICAVP